MSRLNILSTIALCFTSLMATPATNSRLAELTDLGFTRYQYEVCLDVIKRTEDDLYNRPYNAYTSDVPTVFQNAIARPEKSVPEIKEKAYPIGSPVLWVKSYGKYLDGKDATIKVGFAPVGECAIAKGDLFVALLSDVIYVPHTNKVVLRAYSSEPCALAEELFNSLKQSSVTMLSWQVFGADQLRLLYSGTPWNSHYASTRNAKSETEVALMGYKPISGITADDIINGTVTADSARIMMTESGYVAASLNGYGDKEGPSRFVADGVYSNLCIGISKRESGAFLRHECTIRALIGLYPCLKSIPDYVGITYAPVQNPFAIAGEKRTLISANRQAYQKVYVTLHGYLSELPFGSVGNMNELMSKLS